MTHGAALSTTARRDALESMASEELDLLVIGGGIVGAGAALDAVSRGLRTAIVEQHDWAFGTSSRSSKLIHGGLRYLEMHDFRLVAEALGERGLLLQHLAPHLVQPVPFLYPLQHGMRERLYVEAGLLLYDTLGFTSGRSRGLPWHRHLSKRSALRVAPGLAPTALSGAVQYYDARVDDARYTLSVVRTAVGLGALAAARARVVGLLREGNRVGGAQVLDEETGDLIKVRARQVLSATGVWTPDTQALVPWSATPADTSRADAPAPATTLSVRASKGIHLVVPRGCIDSSSGLILRTSNSVLFVIPWNENWIIGTTDTDWTQGSVQPTASSADISDVLEHVNSVLNVPLRRADVVAVYAGLRPLLAADADLPSKLSREHAVRRVDAGLVVVAGGKYTTYRVMARDAVDEVCRRLPTPVPASCTQDLPLVGANGYPALRNQRQRLAETSGLGLEHIDHLLGRYGSMIGELLALIRSDPSLGMPLDGAERYLRAEVVYGVRSEGALHLDDTLVRRTRIAMETPSRGREAARAAAALMAAELKWDEETVMAEVASYQQGAARELDAEQLPVAPAATATSAVAVELPRGPHDPPAQGSFSPS